MAIIKYDPWRTLGQVNQMLDDVFQNKQLSTDESFFAQWRPAVDVKENENNFLVKADLPGVKSEDIDVSWENNLLTISGKREEEKREDSDNYHRVERSSGTFQRSFSLPDSADCENIKAKTKDGVLEIVIPKKVQSQAKKIKIDVE